MTRSQFDGAPRWKVLCVLSVKQPLCAEALSVKLRVKVPPFGTVFGAAEPGSKPGLLAVSDGYVPAGTLNEYWPLPFVVVVRLPSAMVAPEIGLAPSVTVPESVPLPTVVQPG